MNHKSIEELGFYQVVNQMQAHTRSEEGRDCLLELSFLTEQALLSKRQEEIAGLITLLGSSLGGSLLSFPSIKASLALLGDPVKALEGPDLVGIAHYIASSEILQSFCNQALDDGSSFEPLKELMGRSFDENLRRIGRHILDVLDESGQVKESHPALRQLRKEVEARKNERSRFCSQFIHTNREVVQTDQEALRDGRLVIPVRSDKRSNVQGFITSSSATGNTVFMEPYPLVEMNNSVVMAQNQILIEIAKILKQLNDEVRSWRKELSDLAFRVGQTDARLAIAEWAREKQCSRTDLEITHCTLIKARHPLLGKKVVPITMQLDSDIKAVVISGPNAGGKTVTIKTVGLFALLNQFCGYIPAQEGSALPVFDDIYTDIGDEQSIEAELSTFSGHMKQIAYVLSNMTGRSLVILDELGSGTDPVEGSAIARATLEYCLQKAALTLVTSHHGVLKQFAYAKKEVINASMEFNENSHLPTFRIIQGLPGESHALDTARLMKLPRDVLVKAEQYLGSEAVQIGTIIKDLEAKRRDLERQETAMHKRYLALQSEVKALQLKELRIKQREAQLKREQSTELARFMQTKRKELENLVAELRTGEVTKDKTKQVKTYLEGLSEKLAQQEEQLQQFEDEIEFLKPEEAQQLEVGMDVLCGSAKREGKILEKKGRNSFVVAIGTMRMTLPSSQLSLPKRVDQKVSVLFQSSAPEPKLVLDVRGLILEEALHLLDQQIESALVHGMSTFSIIHGYGDGILSKGIGSYLKKHRSVQDYRFALPEDGGMGKTYVML